jgi:hypothetical protein
MADILRIMTELTSTNRVFKRYLFGLANAGGFG